MRKAAIILPTYNESENVKKLVPRIFEITKDIKNWEVHIVVVDSDSPDKTQKIILDFIKKYPRLHLVKTEKKGLGAAYVEGFQIAIEKLKPYVLFEMDADLSHDPVEIPKFLKAIEQGADFVIGSRYIKDGSIPSNWGFHRKIFSQIGNFIVKSGFMKLKIRDWTSGYRAIKVWVVNSSLEKVKKFSGYVFQIAFLDEALKKGANIKEIPIQFTDRQYGKSKIIFGEYIFQILWYIFCNSSFVKYVIVGITGFVIDFGISYFLIEKLKAFIWLSTVLSAEAAIISNFTLNNYWSFSYKKIKGGLLAFIPKFLKFNLVSVGALAIQAVGIQLLANFFGRELWYFYKAGIIICIIIPYSYILYNKVIWKEK